MGSGKGKMRRVGSACCNLEDQPVIATSEVAGVVTEKWAQWQQFTWGSSSADVSLHEYYLGHAPEDITDEEYEKLLAELFADAVVVGAIALPDPYKPADFSFRIINSKIGFSKIVDAEITLKNNPEVRGVFRNVNQCLERNYPLVSPAVARSIKN